jgi:hypothetical protein
MHIFNDLYYSNFIEMASCHGQIRPGTHPPPPEAFGTAPKSFCTPSNYTYFDLIFSYLVILITKFVKLLILWSQMPPCKPRKQVLLNIGLSGRCHQAPAKASSSTPPPERKYKNPSLDSPLVVFHIHEVSTLHWDKRAYFWSLLFDYCYFNTLSCLVNFRLHVFNIQL